jgi:hypothetical protein
MMHHILHLYLDWWRYNTIAAALWSSVGVGVVLMAIHDARALRKERRNA